MRSAVVVLLLGVLISISRADVSDTVWKSIKDKEITLVLKGGTEVVGQLRDFDASNVVMVLSDGRIKDYPRDKIDDVKIIRASTSPSDLTPVCSLYDSAKPISVTVREGIGYSTADARKAVDRIATAIGMQGMPDAFEGNVPNAMATFYGQKRVIVYSSPFMDRVAATAGTKWAYTAILAHELGHHLNGHIAATSTSDSWHQELQADYFSGFALAKLGATLTEAQSAMRTMESLYGPGGSATHPASRLRLDEIEKGFKDGSASQSTNSPAPAPAQTPAPVPTPVPAPPAPAPVPTPTVPVPAPQIPTTVAVGFTLNGNVAIKIDVFIDGQRQGTLTNVPAQGLPSGTIALPPGNHQLMVNGIAQVCNPMGCGTPFPVTGSSGFQAVNGAIYVISGFLSPQGFSFALNRQG